nr:immunoglobulin heavy chain junction region [Macaca mulatta]MOX64916.1 immunoglobulin heavy chain junction region [Macaca mulatta]MOX65827.1 immunoglobulin heavy chain junction region [Macaca mulatta]MOX65886.1 immunoglobulin heavy chain junction region [Macaca mulatta]MOX68442.1 immunoglobulin heavy chain junction region [Macaca mulatta]
CARDEDPSIFEYW